MKLPRVTWTRAAMVGSVVLCLARLPFSRFFADDFFLLGELEGVSPLPGRPPFWLYALADGNPAHLRRLENIGVWPWFFDDRFRMNFCRPLGSALIAVDHWLFGLRPLGYIVHNCLWYLVLIAAVARLFQQKLPRRVAGPAMFIYATSGIFHLAVGWTAARPHVAAAAIAAWAYVSWTASHQGGRVGSRYRWLAVGGFALGLGFSESGFIMMAYPVVEEAWGRDWRGSLRRLAPLLALATMYLALYFGLGFGAQHGGGYTSPFSQPGTFLIDAPLRAATLATSLLLSGASDLGMVSSFGRTALAMLAPLALAALAFAYRSTMPLLPRSERDVVDRLLEGTVACSLPLLAAPMFSFHLVIPFIGVAAFAAHVLVAREPRGVPNSQRTGVLVSSALAGGLFLGLGPASRLLMPALTNQVLADRTEKAVAHLDAEVQGLDHTRIVVLNAPDILAALDIGHVRRLMRLPMPSTWWTLYLGKGEMVFSRPAANVFTLDWRTGGIAPTTRDAGDVVELEGADIEVTHKEGSRITGIRCRLDRPLDDAAWRFLTWRDGSLHLIDVPPTGGSLVVLAGS
ncbi:MAG: hypothetical protein ABTD50_03135 [Polyangiaceae bacterium]